MKWPGEAAVIVSVVHVKKGNIDPPFDLDGGPVDTITAYLLRTAATTTQPALLQIRLKSFKGFDINGMGFTFDDTGHQGIASSIAEMHELIARNPPNASRIFPYLGGEELNTSPTQSHHRYVINFENMTEAEARRWPDLMRIIESKVKPGRMTNSREPYRRCWWQFGEKRFDLQAAKAGLERVIVIAQTSRTLAFVFQSPTIVFGNTLVVITHDKYAVFAALQSRVHREWALTFAAKTGG